MPNGQTALKVTDTLHCALRVTVLKDASDFVSTSRDIVEIKHRLSPHSWYDNREWRELTARDLEAQIKRVAGVEARLTFVKEEDHWLLVVANLGSAVDKS